jgi:hypothetical protein
VTIGKRDVIEENTIKDVIINMIKNTKIDTIEDIDINMKIDVIEIMIENVINIVTDVILELQAPKVQLELQDHKDLLV